MIKKTTSALLSVIFFSFAFSPLAVFANEKESLAQFLKTTDEVEANYAYPNMNLVANTGSKSSIPPHTPIIIKCSETITTKDIVSGSKVNFSVVNDIKDKNGLVLIKAGSPVSAQITFAKDNGMVGRSGQITVSDFHTVAVDGSYVPLSGTISTNPEDKLVLSVVLSALFCPLFLLIRGDEARMPAGTTKTVYTVSETFVKATRI